MVAREARDGWREVMWPLPILRGLRGCTALVGSPQKESVFAYKATGGYTAQRT
ncbi:hypothetical protein SAZ_39530 [Streptomyces noursei ZPM]|nr:hypothetical protein SAZ_39530 [Streptomyces noursei ZPM]EPY93262.1 hypothetical protein K530_48955 [Streptomyces noursei CCRC 11814]